MKIDGNSFPLRRILLLEENGQTRLLLITNQEKLDTFEKDPDFLGVLPQFQLGLIHIYQKRKLRNNVENESEALKTQKEEKEKKYSELKYQKDFSHEFTLVFSKILGDLTITAWKDPLGELVYTWQKINQKQRAA
ncbi:MAG: hypothetical protein ACTSXV_00255 [Alphaproteobacteria bacterium]